MNAAHQWHCTILVRRTSDADEGLVAGRTCRLPISLHGLPRLSPGVTERYKNCAHGLPLNVAPRS
eukprot:11032548-Lingulodinium_polyedra.AAC.1